MKKIVNNKLVFHGVSGVLSFIFSLGIFLFFKLPVPFSELFFIVTLFGMIFLIEKAFDSLNRKVAVVSGIFAAILSATIVIGNKIYFWCAPYYDAYTVSDFWYWLIFTGILFFMIVNVCSVVQKYTLEFSEKNVGIKFWLIVSGIIAVCWLPYFILYFPGNLTGDSYSSINQSIGVTPLNNHCPVLFTLLVKVCIKLGLVFSNLNMAIGVFSLVQMLVMAVILGYSVFWMAGKKLPTYIVILTLAFYSLNPVIALYAMTMWKDILFGGWMLLLMLFIFDSVESRGKWLLNPKGLAAFSICCLLVAFGRNNGVYVVFALLIALGIYFRKYFKTLVPVFVAITVVIVAVQGPLFTALNIGKSEFAESVGIPLQQIGYTLKYDGKVTEEQKEFLNQLIPIEKVKEVYNPESPDYIKFNEEFNNQFLEENKGEFLKIWAEMLIPNLNSYVKAYLAQTIGYWHIGTTNWICQFGIGDNTMGLHSAQHVYIQNKIQNSIEDIKNVPVFRDLFSIAFMVWLTFFGCVVMILKRNYSNLFSILPLLAVWVTMMIAVPTFCEFRYMFSFHLVLPFLLVWIFQSSKKKTAKAS